MPEGVAVIAEPRRHRAKGGHGAHNWSHRVSELEAAFQAVTLAQQSTDLALRLLWLRANSSTWGQCYLDLVQRSLL